MKKVLVTGATGFIGRYVVEALLSAGQRVIATSAHEDKARRMPWFADVQYIPFDLADLQPGDDYHHFFGRPDVLIHLAWEGLPNYKSSFHLESNYPRHAAFLDNLLQHGLRDCTVVGTCLEYGMREGCLREDMQPHPDNAYAIAKDKLRLYLEDRQSRQPFIFRWARLFYLYGEGQGPNSLLPQLDRALDNGDRVFNMSPGDQLRDFLPVEEAAGHICRISLQRSVTGIVNCCSGSPISVEELVLRHLAKRKKHIALNLGYYPYPDYEPFAFWGDITRLKSIEI
jgi:nucleoside-diphosphate-sugar epimerase